MQRAILVVAAVGVLLCMPCVAQTPPHTIILTPITYSDMTTMVLAVDMSFEAWISTRPAEVISGASPGSTVADGMLLLDVSAFPTAWAVGETLLMHVHGAGSNYIQPEDREFVGVLTETAVAWLTELGPNGEFFLPVELSSFSAVPQSGSVLITWVTSSEADNAGFNILRSEEDAGIYHRINSTLIPGAGTCTERHEYSFRDDGVVPGTNFYLLESVATDGTSERFGPVSATIRPMALTLSVVPNPTQGEATIAFSLLQEAPVSVSIHDIGGRVVWGLPPRMSSAGGHAVAWDGCDWSGCSVSPGTYLCRITTETGTASARLVVAR